jgi:hypothetical protein
LCSCASVGLEPADLALAIAGHSGDQLSVLIDDSQAGVSHLDGDELSCVGQADLDALAGDLDAATRPGRFDIRRKPNSHLVFGHGPHFCMGAGLARTQMRALFGEVLARTSSLRYAGQPSYLRSNFQRGVKRLPITWIA